MAMIETAPTAGRSIAPREVVTISIDYEDYARADETARNEGSTLYDDIMSLIRGKIGDRTVLHTPDEVRAHFGRLMDEAAAGV